MLGLEGKWLYVNSGDGVSRAEVKRRFGDAADYGTIPWSLVERELGPDAIVGGVTVRLEFQREWLRQSGRSITKGHALTLLRSVPLGTWHETTFTMQNSLTVLVGNLLEARTDGIDRRCEHLIHFPKPSIT